MDKYIVIFVFAFVLSGSEAIETFYLEDYCDSIIDVGFSDQIKLKLTHGGKYVSSWQCEVQVTAESGGQVMLYFNSMNIPSSYDCENNFLEIDDGGSRGSPYISGGKQCGYSPPGGVLTTRGQYLTLYFQKDSTYEYVDFDMVLTSYHTGRCSSWEYECSNGRCIDESINCNDNNPCGDYSDCEDNDFTFTLDVGAVVGIVVGGSVIVVIVILALVLVRRRRTDFLRERTPIIGTEATRYGGYNQPVPAQYAAPPPYPGQIQHPPLGKGLNQNSA